MAMFAVSVGLACALSSEAANMPDFSGSYSLKSVKGEDKPDSGDALSLQVAQTATEIKITTVTDGHPSTERFSLNQNGAKCTDADGGDATCTAQWKGKTLVLERVYTAHPTENGPDVEMHTRERLDLSSDGKTLTIRTDTKAPDYPALQMTDDTTEVYARN